MKVNPYFKESELRCKCCGALIVSSDLINRLTAAREEAGIPFVITSGYRCVKHNKEVDGEENSAHTKGYAVDIKCSTSATRMKLMKVLPKYFNRIGINKAFIHCDCDPSLPQNVCFMY